jgi:ABC-type uncharacterized transport system ATPase subunit
VIFSSHLLEQVQEVADRVAIFSLGKKVLEGSLDSLLTENQSTQINIPADLNAEQQQRLREAIAKAGIAEGDIQFTRPHLSLEQLYLRTVQHQADLAANKTPGK